MATKTKATKTKTAPAPAPAPAPTPTLPPVAGRKAPAPKAPAPKAPIGAYVTTKDATELVCRNAAGAKDAAIAARAGAFVWLLTQGATLRAVLQEKRPEMWQNMRKAVGEAAGEDEAQRWATDVRKLAALRLGVNLIALRNEGDDVTQEESKALHEKAIATLAALTLPGEDGKLVTYAGAVARAVAEFKTAHGNPHGLRQAFDKAYGKLRHVAEGKAPKTKAEDEGAKDEGPKDEGAKDEGPKDEGAAPALPPVTAKVALRNIKALLDDLLEHGADAGDVAQKDVLDVLTLTLRFASEPIARRVSAMALQIADKLSAPARKAPARKAPARKAPAPKAPKAPAPAPAPVAA